MAMNPVSGATTSPRVVRYKGVSKIGTHLPLLQTIVVVTALGMPANAKAKPAAAVTIGSKTASMVRTQELQAPLDGPSGLSRGWQKCTRSGTTSAPVLTIDVQPDTPEISVRIEDKNGRAIAGMGGILVMEGGLFSQGFFCTTKGDAYIKDPAAGRYALFFSGSSRTARGFVRVEIPARTAAVARAELDRLPTLSIAASGPNPRFQEFPLTRIAESQDLNFGCYNNRTAFAPIAKVVGGEKTTLRIRKHRYVLTDSAGATCARDMRAQSSDRRVPPGEHVVWVNVDRDTPPAKFHFELDDGALPLNYGEPQSKKRIDKLDTLLVVEGIVQPPGDAPNRERQRCAKLPMTPDLQVESGLLQNVHIRLLPGQGDQNLAVWQPAENTIRNCDGGLSRTVPVFEGTRQFWVGGSPGSTYRIAFYPKDKPPTGDTLIGTVKPGSTLAERELSRHYPFLQAAINTEIHNYEATRLLWSALFLRAPEPLYVYARADVGKAGEASAATGEPLLVWSATSNSTRVVTWDGDPFNVDPRLLTLQRPAEVALPLTPTPTGFVTDVRSAMNDGAPADMKDVTKHRKLIDTYRGCYLAYMTKHDPSFGKDYDIIKISGDKVTNVGNKAAARARRKCGRKKLDRKSKALIKLLTKRRDARRAATLAAVRKRFEL